MRMIKTFTKFHIKNIFIYRVIYLFLVYFFEILLLKSIGDAKIKSFMGAKFRKLIQGILNGPVSSLLVSILRLLGGLKNLLIVIQDFWMKMNTSGDDV